jgi:ABC-type cobalamin/Fe3+-siderophores transport system ATPase subunit
VLRDVTVSLRPGTLVGITGIGSSGISTLLAVLGGVSAPDAGVVRVGDTDLYAGPAADGVDPPLGFVPRFVDFPRGLTVRDALAQVPVTVGRDVARISSFTRRVWRPVKGRDRRRGTVDLPSPERVDEVLAEMGLTDAAQAKMRDLPEYDRRLVLVAAALLADPHWLFADEPTSGLMPEEAGQMAALLHSLAGGTRGVVVTSHHHGELQRCDPGVSPRRRLSCSWFLPSWVIAVVFPVPAGPDTTSPRRAERWCRLSRTRVRPGRGDVADGGRGHDDELGVVVRLLCARDAFPAWRAGLGRAGSGRRTPACPAR